MLHPIQGATRIVGFPRKNHKIFFLFTFIAVSKKRLHDLRRSRKPPLYWPHTSLAVGLYLSNRMKTESCYRGMQTLLLRVVFGTCDHALTPSRTL